MKLQFLGATGTVLPLLIKQGFRGIVYCTPATFDLCRIAARQWHHIKTYGPHKRNTILLTGFQAGGTQGASLAAGASSVRIHGEDVPIRGEVAQLACASAHADAAEIEAWLSGMKAAPTTTFISHGEPAAADAMRQRIERGLGWKVCVPDCLETYAT